SRADRSIDFAWTNDLIVIADDTAIADQAADTVWQNVSADEYLQSLETSGSGVQRHPYFREMNGSAASLSSARRQAFLTKLLAHPALLDVLNPREAVTFYQAFRFGAADKALDVFGLWAVRHADHEAVLTVDRPFERDAREMYSSMALCATQQLPEQAARLQSEFLELDDGRCCLPVAYTLAYSYLGRGRLDEWIALLNDKLNANSITGDRRVNWLLARAHAEEIRYERANPYVPHGSRATDGRVYLDEGLIVAESPAVKARVAKEIAARLVSSMQFSAGREALQQTPNPQPDVQNALLATVDKLEAAEAARQAKRAVAARQAYASKLRERRERASAAGNTDAVSRYDALIEAADSQ
ncbi:MAG: hypothetical protein WEH44_07275, partial [Pirellulaceae bacterium]